MEAIIEPMATDEITKKKSTELKEEDLGQNPERHPCVVAKTHMAIQQRRLNKWSDW